MHLRLGPRSESSEPGIVYSLPSRRASDEHCNEEIRQNEKCPNFGDEDPFNMR